MFQQRQFNEVYTLVEVSSASINGVGLTTLNRAVSGIISPVVGNINSGGPSQMQLGDVIEAIPSTAVGAPGGLLIQATVLGPGQLTISYLNVSGSTVTLATGVWTFIVRRVAANVT